MNGKITLIQYPGLTGTTTLSPPCGKVHMALRVKGLEYEVRNLSTPGQVKRVNPRGRVPVLQIDGETVVDSTDIISAVDARWPDPPLEAEDPVARARIRLLEDWADEVLYFFGVWYRWVKPDNMQRMQSEVLSRLPIPVRWIVPHIARREVRRRLNGQGLGLKEQSVIHRELCGSLDMLATLAGQSRFLVGDTLTRADIAGVAVLDQLRITRLTPDVADEINTRPALTQWIDRVHAIAPNAAEPDAPAPSRKQA